MKMVWLAMTKTISDFYILPYFYTQRFYFIITIEKLYYFRESEIALIGCSVDYDINGPRYVQTIPMLHGRGNSNAPTDT